MRERAFITESKDPRSRRAATRVVRNSHHALDRFNEDVALNQNDGTRHTNRAA